MANAFDNLVEDESCPEQDPGLRILMIAPTSFFGDYGCHVRILEEARTLQRLGHRVTIVTYRNGRDISGVDIRRTLPIPWRQHYEVGSSRHKIVFDALLGLKTIQMLLRERFDVIHGHLHEGALIGLVIGRLFHLPVIFDFQGSLTEEMIDHKFLQRDGLVHRLMYRLEKWIDHSVHYTLTSSSNAEQILIKDFACDPERIRPLPDCVDISTFAPLPESEMETRSAERVRLGIPHDAQVIVYLGLLAEYQGTSLLLEAMQKLCSTHPSVYLLLMGFPSIDYYQAMAKNLGVADRVIFTGKIPYEDAPSYLKLGDVAVSPKLSATEGAGKLLNYMALGLPTVAFDTPVAHEYLGGHGIFARKGDASSLAEALIALLENPNMRDIGEQLRQRAVMYYDWNRSALKIVDTYKKALHSGERPLANQPQISSVDQR